MRQKGLVGVLAERYSPAEGDRLAHRYSQKLVQNRTEVPAEGYRLARLEPPAMNKDQAHLEKNRDAKETSAPAVDH